MADENENVTVSSNWNGIVYTAHASDGKRFGTATAGTDEEAREAAVKDLGTKGATTEPPVLGGSHSTADPGAEQEAAKAAGRTGDKGK